MGPARDAATTDGVELRALAALRAPHRSQPRPPRGSAARHEPAHLDAISKAEIERALDDPDPLRDVRRAAVRTDAPDTN